MYYTSKAYVGQIKKGEDYPKLNQVIFIGILDFNSFEGDNYLTRHLILKRETLNQDLRDLEFNFIELKKFNKQEEHLETIIEKWIYFIKNAGSLAYIPASLSLLPEFSHAFTIANEAGLSLEEQEAQWKRKDFIMLQKGSIELAEKKGMEKGIEKGIEKGMEKRTIEFANEMIKNGESNEKIRKYTGLTDDEIEKLRG